MCGIVGYAGRPPEKMKPAFRAFMNAAMVETQVRGPHATGVASWIGGTRSVIGKGPVDAVNFIKVPIWERALEGQALIGHCRYATHGSPGKNENNHPFEQGRWAMVHNGIVSDYQRIAKEQGVHLTTECDSEVILRVFAKGAKKGNARAGLQRFVDAVAHSRADYAVAILDRADGTIRLLRDDGRPCAILRLPGLGIVAFASTKEILSRAFDAMFKEFPETALLEGAESWDCVRDRIYVLKPDSLEVEHEDIKINEKEFNPSGYGKSSGDLFAGGSSTATSTGVWRGNRVQYVCHACGYEPCRCSDAQPSFNE